MSTVHFSIDASSAMPVADQLFREVVFAIAGGSLHPGDLVPSADDLNQQFAIGADTVAKVYSDLQSKEILAPVSDARLAVADQAESRCQQERGRLFRDRWQQIVTEAKQGRLSNHRLSSSYLQW